MSAKDFILSLAAVFSEGPERLITQMLTSTCSFGFAVNPEYWVTSIDPEYEAVTRDYAEVTGRAYRSYDLASIDSSAVVVGSPAGLAGVIRLTRETGARPALMPARSLPHLALLMFKQFVTSYGDRSLWIDAIAGQETKLDTRQHWGTLAIHAHGEGGHANLGYQVLCGADAAGETNLNGVRIADSCAPPERCRRAGTRVVLPANDVRAQVWALLSCGAGTIDGTLLASTNSVVMAGLQGWANRIYAPDGVVSIPRSRLGAIRAEIGRHEAGHTGHEAVLHRLESLSYGGPWVFFGDPAFVRPESAQAPHRTERARPTKLNASTLHARLSKLEFISGATRFFELGPLRTTHTRDLARAASMAIHASAVHARTSMIEREPESVIKAVTYLRREFSTAITQLARSAGAKVLEATFVNYSIPGEQIILGRRCDRCKRRLQRDVRAVASQPRLEVRLITCPTCGPGWTSLCTTEMGSATDLIEPDLSIVTPEYSEFTAKDTAVSYEIGPAETRPAELDSDGLGTDLHTVRRLFVLDDRITVRRTRYQHLNLLGKP